jgi:hypothetical protein
MNRKGIYNILLALLSIAFISSSCNKSDEPQSDPSGNLIVSFQKDVQPIFDHNCISCHPNSGNMSLLEGEAYDNLVDVISPVYNLVRVSPFKADSSVICFKLHGIEGFGHLMPLNGIPLEDAEIKLIEDWIDQGALNN